MVKAAANCKSSFSLEKTSDVFDTCLISLVWTRSVSLDFAPVGKIKTESEVKLMISIEFTLQTGVTHFCSIKLRDTGINNVRGKFDYSFVAKLFLKLL